MTPLHWAVERGNVGAIEVLLKHGASPDLESKFGKSSLDIASDNGRPDLYEILLVICELYLTEINVKHCKQGCGSGMTSIRIRIHHLTQSGYGSGLSQIIESGSNVDYDPRTELKNKKNFYVSTGTFLLHCMALGSGSTKVMESESNLVADPDPQLRYYGSRFAFCQPKDIS
jgi:hypothetical protein